MDNMSKPLFLPALRALMGDWVYYSTIMKFKDIGERVKPAEEIHESKTLKDFIQRHLTSRSSEISEYLLTQPQRFFNSLIIGVYGGDPKWIELKIEKSDQLPDFPLSENGILGYLKLSGEELLFALSGQHRVEGIKKAIEKKKDLSSEEISVIFIGHKRTPEGKERTRRLFATLNRYAKPVNVFEIIALDEDDIGAILTRDLIEIHPLFADKRLSFTKSAAIPKLEKNCFTNIITLYKIINELLSVYLKNNNYYKKGQWKKYLKTRPDQTSIDCAKEYIIKVLNLICEKFEVLQEYLEFNDSKQDKAFKYRNDNGGHILFRPIGLLIYVRAICSALEEGWELEKTIHLASKIETDLGKSPWVGLLWESGSKNMITNGENQKVAIRLIRYMIGLDTDEKKLRNDYASKLNKKSQEINLPPKVL